MKADEAFRIVRKSNFDKDWYNEEFADNSLLMSKELADLRCKHLNASLTLSSEHYYQVVDSTYKLYIGMVP